MLHERGAGKQRGESRRTVLVLRLVSDGASAVAYASDGHDLLRGSWRGVANVYLWVRPR